MSRPEPRPPIAFAASVAALLWALIFAGIRALR